MILEIARLIVGNSAECRRILKRLNLGAMGFFCGVHHRPPCMRVIPAKAGIPLLKTEQRWISAFAGRTNVRIGCA